MPFMQALETAFAGPSFNEILTRNGLQSLRRAALQELQINLGKLCNQACNHCHVDAGPKRTEIMSWHTAQRIIEWIKRSGVRTVDITGGAPEMNPCFRLLVDQLVSLEVSVTARCNLSILLQPGYTDLPEWYAERGVRLACSLPCYTEDNVDNQRGNGVFARSIKALQTLNAVGYGLKENLVLDLVYNPGGAYLPPPQSTLESQYKQRLFDDFAISFNRLLTITNLPISRFAHFLERNGQRESYQKLLVDNFNAATVGALMCRHLISVDWRGRIFDCDFNQMLELPYAGSQQRYLWDVDVDQVMETRIAVGAHCFGCTAGSGSSCGGALE